MTGSGRDQEEGDSPIQMIEIGEGIGTELETVTPKPFLTQMAASMMGLSGRLGRSAGQ